ALAMARAGADAPALVTSEDGWSRRSALDWIEARIADQADLLIGCDFSFALPFADCGAYFPQWSASPADAKALWNCVEGLSADEPHFSASRLADHPELARHFRSHAGGQTHVGDLFEPGLGRLRVTEKACREQGLGNAASCFNLIGASQVGKSSFTGMRMLHRLSGRIAIWPFDPLPETGPVLVEIYTALAARRAGLTGPTKLRARQPLDAALAALGSRPHDPIDRYDDHSTDALLGAAWLRHAAGDAGLWRPKALDALLAQTEGWTFGVS
ncbi:MAG: hypothetical protein LC634_00210, partial [Sphingomonadales bacterium]|nr:hypothetical protein [Sphingomonadales bacterium]